MLPSSSWILTLFVVATSVNGHLQNGVYSNTIDGNNIVSFRITLNHTNNSTKLREISVINPIPFMMHNEKEQHGQIPPATPLLQRLLSNRNRYRHASKTNGLLQYASSRLYHAAIDGFIKEPKFRLDRAIGQSFSNSPRDRHNAFYPHGRQSIGYS